MKFDKSRELYEQSKKSLAGGVSSQGRMDEKPFPLFFERAEGPYLYDVDGNQYVDYWMGAGPTIFGHAPEFLVEAVSENMRRGQIFAGQHELEVTVSELVQQIVPCAELVRYSSSGTEVVQAALRVARAYTGRNKFIKFEGHYHGWMDNINYSVAPPLDAAGAYDAPDPVRQSEGMAPGLADDIIILPWNNIDILRQTLDRQGDEVAAIITEPIMCNTNCILPKPGYLEEMRRLCDEHGVVLIFDEVINGFRVALGGGQELTGVTPDVATFAKAIAGGFPLSMLAGKREIMSLFEDGTVMHSGTLNSNVMSMAAAEVSLKKLMEDDGAAYRHMYAIGRRLMDGLREIAQKHEHPVIIQGPGPAFGLTFTDADEITDYRSYTENADHDKAEKFRQGMLEHGVRIMARGLLYVSTSHTEEEIDRTLAAADEVMSTL